MNSFSDLSDIDPTLLFRTKIRPIYQSRPPRIEIGLNHAVLFSGVLTSIWCFETDLALLDPLMFEVRLLDKVYDLGDETAAVVDQLEIDDFALVPDYNHVFQYENDHGFTGATSYVGFVGTWRLVIDEPFYRWRHRVTGQGWLLEP